MSSYYDYQDDADYAKEIYWEAKGLGNASPSTATPNRTPAPQIECERCHRRGSAEQVASHNIKYPNCAD
jgi:hypothetical protein